MRVQDITIEQYANRQLLKTNTVRKVTPLRKVSRMEFLDKSERKLENKEAGSKYNRRV